MHNFTRRQFLLASAATLASGGVSAQAWPTKAIRLVVPFPPGGLIDNMARLITPSLTRILGQPIVIENKPGAGGNIGAGEVARARADGYTLLMASPALTISPAIYPQLPYKREQITPLVLIGQVPNVLVVSAKSNIASVQDLLARAKAAPGKLNYGSNGNGTSLHLSAELLKMLGNVSIVHIPYKGAAAALTALLAGEVEMMFDNLPSVLGQIQAGTVKALAVTTRRRSKTLPDCPTLIELGFADFNVSAWYGVAAPTGLPAPVQAKIVGAINAVAKDKNIITSMETAGANIGFLNPELTRAYAESEAGKWQRVVSFAKISVDP
jgi:tripartite-type tricarboxylate transporter receptor subunit TctC